MPRLSFKRAKELSLLKWDKARKTGLSVNTIVAITPELQSVRFGCGFCEYYKYHPSYNLKACRKCPIGKKDHPCYNNLSLYHRYVDVGVRSKREEIASALYKIIENSSPSKQRKTK